MKYIIKLPDGTFTLTHVLGTARSEGSTSDWCYCGMDYLRKSVCPISGRAIRVADINFSCVAARVACLLKWGGKESIGEARLFYGPGVE